MKVLFVHPADYPSLSTSQKWDWMIDLGWAPTNIYDRWTREFTCLVEPLEKYHRPQQDLDFFRSIAQAGKYLTDKENINWWQLFLLYFTDRIQQIACLRRLAESLNENDDVFFTRPCFEAEALRHLRNSPSRFENDHSRQQRLRHYFHEIWTLPVRQLRQIFWDKYDPAFVLRGKFTRAKTSSTAAQILVPSTYVNTSRTAMGFASNLPDHKFLLVTTRASGNIPGAPHNVEIASIGRYASTGHLKAEYEQVVDTWKSLGNDLALDPETAIAHSLGMFNGFPEFLKQGLGIRNAWLRLFEHEPVEAVLCCDNSPFVLLPVQIGRQRNIPTVSCHHGALDWRYGILPVYADVVVAKGMMEMDYLTRVCGVPAEKVRLGAPVLPHRILRRDETQSDSSIVFFSEPYEGHGARGQDVYKEVIGPLADLALQTGRKLVIKLHPFESIRKRKRLVKKILSKEQQKIVQVVAGPLTTGLLNRTWAGVAVVSTAGLDCAGAGVPCFLCEWLQYPDHGYGDQFRRFNVGYALQSAKDIQAIPEMIRLHPQKPTADDLWQLISSVALKELFSKEEKLSSTVSN